MDRNFAASRCSGRRNSNNGRRHPQRRSEHVNGNEEAAGQGIQAGSGASAAHAAQKGRGIEIEELRDPAQAQRRTKPGTKEAAFLDLIRRTLPKLPRDTASRWAGTLRQGLLSGCTPDDIGEFLREKGITRPNEGFAEARKAGALPPDAGASEAAPAEGEEADSGKPAAQKGKKKQEREVAHPPKRAPIAKTGKAQPSSLSPPTRFTPEARRQHAELTAKESVCDLRYRVRHAEGVDTVYKVSTLVKAEVPTKPGTTGRRPAAGKGTTSKKRRATGARRQTPKRA